MNAVSVIKESFKDIKKITRTHFTLAMLGAFFISIIAVVRLPLYPKLLSASDWFLIFLPPLISLFFFYAAEEKPIRSVFWFTRLIYLIFSPFIVIAVGDIGYARCGNYVRKASIPVVAVSLAFRKQKPHFKNLICSIVF